MEMDIDFDSICRIVVIATDAFGRPERWLSVEMAGGEMKRFQRPKDIKDFVAALRRDLPEIADRLQIELTEKRDTYNWEYTVYRRT